MRGFNVQDVTGQPRATKWARMKLIMTEFPSVFMTLAPIGKNRPRGLLGRLLGRWRATGRFTEKLGLVKNRDSRRRFTSALVVLIAA